MMTRSTLDTGMTATLPDETVPPPHGLIVCKGCRRWVDPTMCGCGVTIGSGGACDNHSPVPMGCDCYRVPQ